MLSALSWTIYLVLCGLSGVHARAIDTDVASIPTSDISSSTLAESTVATASSQSCNDLRTCRTLDQIVVSCLTTILACVWFAVHRNIPAPVQNPSKGLSPFVRAAKRVWSVVRAQMDAAMVFAVALLAPEWILAWALRQVIVAWKLAGTLEEARLEAKERQKGVDFGRDARNIATSADGHSSMDGSVATHTGSETIHLIKRRSDPSIIHSTCDKCERHGCQCDLFAAAKRVAKGDECWVMSHAFFVAMGGFCFYNEGGPLYPLSPANVIELVKRGHLVPPTAEEISNQSKGDALSKGVAVAQTLWFVVQCIARRAEDLPVTTFEVMTLAYTVMTVAMYAAWWAKPLNVSCAIRVPEEDVEGRIADKYDSIGARISAYVVGTQDDYVNLRQCTRVPTFWAGMAAGGDTAIADVIALFVAMAFGAVHCIAWHSEFPSHLEQQLWRSSAIAIIAVPPALLVGLLPAGFLGDLFDADVGGEFLIGVLYTILGIIYIAARLTLITLSFTLLRGLPFSAFQTVQWTTFIPHI